MGTARKLRLGPLPKTESVKLTYSCPSDPKAELDRYAALHTQTYGESTDALALIPHMLEAFMVRDRGFKKPAALRQAHKQPTNAENAFPEERL